MTFEPTGHASDVAFCEAAWHRQAFHLSEACLKALIQAWSEPTRHYHTLTHLREMLTGFDRFQGTLALTHPEEIQAAIWFHDAIYNPQRQDNEAQSAAWAQQVLEAAGWSAEAVERTVQMILRTQGHRLPANTDEAFLLDLDLMILGSSPERFEAYEAQIRQEYAWVPQAIYARERRRILSDFQAVAPLFQTPSIRVAYETQARTNLDRLIRRLES